MGLDMHLFKNTYVRSWDHMAPEERTTVTITKGDTPVSGIVPSRISEVVEEVMYWRKANAIHAWFVRHAQNGVDNCSRYYVSEEQLEELLKTCIEVRAGTPEDAHRLLPSRSGVFFGGTDYDGYYYDNVNDTITALTALLKEDGYGEYYYQSSW